MLIFLPCVCHFHLLTVFSIGYHPRNLSCINVIYIIQSANRTHTHTHRHVDIRLCLLNKVCAIVTFMYCPTRLAIWAQLPHSFGPMSKFANKHTEHTHTHAYIRSAQYTSEWNIHRNAISIILLRLFVLFRSNLALKYSSPFIAFYVEVNCIYIVICSSFDFSSALFHCVRCLSVGGGDDNNNPNVDDENDKMLYWNHAFDVMWWKLSQSAHSPISTLNGTTHRTFAPNSIPKFNRAYCKIENESESESEQNKWREAVCVCVCVERGKVLRGMPYKVTIFLISYHI